MQTTWLVARLSFAANRLVPQEGQLLRCKLEPTPRETGAIFGGNVYKHRRNDDMVNFTSQHHHQEMLCDADYDRMSENAYWIVLLKGGANKLPNLNNSIRGISSMPSETSLSSFSPLIVEEATTIFSCKGGLREEEWRKTVKDIGTENWRSNAESGRDPDATHST